MLHLMNSPMMPSDGTYTKTVISISEYKRIFELHKDNYKSYIGYPDTCNMLRGILGEKIPISRDQTDLKNGDIILVCRLTYRVDHNDKAKRREVTPADFEFSKVTFELK